MSIEIPKPGTRISTCATVEGGKGSNPFVTSNWSFCFHGSTLSRTPSYTFLFWSSHHSVLGHPDVRPSPTSPSTPTLPPQYLRVEPFSLSDSRCPSVPY